MTVFRGDQWRRLSTSGERRLAALRTRVPVADHLIRALTRYVNFNGSLLAAGVTYYAVLSFFPLLALTFATIGWVTRHVDGTEHTLVQVVTGLLPGIVGSGPAELSVSTLQNGASATAGIGAVALLYSGLSWISDMRSALLIMFDTPAKSRPHWLVARGHDVLALLAIGAVLLVSVGVTAAHAVLADDLTISLGAPVAYLVAAGSVLLGASLSAVLFHALYVLLATPPVPRRSLWSGAIVGGVGFEILKQLSSLVLRSTRNELSVQVLGVALVLLVWIYYFSRLVMFSAAWAATSSTPPQRPATA